MPSTRAPKIPKSLTHQLLYMSVLVKASQVGRPFGTDKTCPNTRAIGPRGVSEISGSNGRPLTVSQVLCARCGQKVCLKHRFEDEPWPVSMSLPVDETRSPTIVFVTVWTVSIYLARGGCVRGDGLSFKDFEPGMF